MHKIDFKDIDVPHSNSVVKISPDIKRLIIRQTKLPIQDTIQERPRSIAKERFVGL